jgi:putative DNA primase/helicase
MAANYDDVLGQLRDAGLLVDTLEIGTTRMVRCKVEGGGREKRGWYMLHELQTPSGELLIVGSYGVWRGNDNSSSKIELRKRDKEFSQEQRDALKRRIAEDRKKAEAARKREADIAARRAEDIWAKLAPTGESDYLANKGVAPHGLRFTPNGSAVLPLLDANGRLHGLQFLRTAAQAKIARRPAKEFWPAGLIKKGHFHLIGAPDWIVLVAEGYATAATLHEATGYPVAVAFDAGNLAPVSEALRKRYPKVRILICADDDAFSEGNPGVSAASAAALSVSGAYAVPRFADDDARRAKHAANGHKLTDYNDVHALEGLHVVRTQIEARLSELQWSRPAPKIAVNPTIGGEGNAAIVPFTSYDELLKRFALVYGQGGTVFDRQEHCLVTLSDMRDACVRKDVHRFWMEHPARDIVRVSEVGFDPGGDDPQVTCNLWAGWPTQPVEGKCSKLLDLLWHMCSGESDAQRLYDWVLRWIAYPIQHPGAKMKTTLVLHGPQGTGKNMFFEALMGIYGQYGRIIDQSAIEDRFNDWASRKLFLIADEVIARSDLYHVKNKLKAFITGDRIRINPKNMAAYEEQNHVNVVFLSNETMPVVLDEDDRRHAVIWTPEKLDTAFYQEVIAEIRNGGVAALHHYLLNVPLGDFSNGSLPPKTAAKDELIGLGLDSPLRFTDELEAGFIDGLLPRPAPSREWYEAYKIWCHRDGVRAAPMNKFLNAIERKRGIQSPHKRYLINQQVLGPHSMLMLGKTDHGEVSERIFLGDETITFRAALNDYRGKA